MRGVSHGEQRVDLEGKAPKNFSKRSTCAWKDQGLWAAAIPSGCLEPRLKSSIMRARDAAALCAPWGLSVDGSEDEDSEIRKLRGHKSRLEERDHGFCAKHLRRISSGFWGALTPNWSKNESAVGSPVLDPGGSC